jgi:phenylpropionate dioxygenase-like ring-hydroxylating dioxygenase large terminal subunit
VPIQICGEKIMLIREGGTVRALHDRCPHRGVPLSHPMATQEFPGTWTCCYHGWTFDLESGTLVAAITDGPESPICGKVAVKTYPIEERLGIVWLWIGDGEPVPVEDDIPENLFEDGPETAYGRMRPRPGNWRFGAENGQDDGHARYLHRNSLWATLTRMPVWNRIKMVREGPWLKRPKVAVYFDADFPGLGPWPRKRPWYRNRPGGAVVAIRLPGTLRVEYKTWTHFEWWVPIDAETHLYVQLGRRNKRKYPGRLGKLRFWLYYNFWVRWIFHGAFNHQDELMVDVMDSPPERLYRPDVSIIEWRRLVEETSRGPAISEAYKAQIAGLRLDSQAS